MTRRSRTIAAVTPFVDGGGYKRRFALQRLTYGAFVSVKRKYLYIETPKAACTSVKQLVARLEGVTVDTGLAPTQKESRLDMLIHQRDRLAIPSLVDLPPQLAKKILEQRSGYFVFSLVRNPYSRLVSVFENKFRQAEIAYRRFGRRWLDAQPFGGIKGAFADFVRVAFDEECLEQRDAHLRLQGSLILIGTVPYTRVFEMEKIDAFKRTFSAHLRQLGESAKIELPRSNISPTRDWRAYYSRETAQKVLRIYQADFDAFGYDPDSWKGAKPTSEESSLEVQLREEIAARNEMIEHLYDRLARSSS